jgi:hypothetical protein
LDLPDNIAEALTVDRIETETFLAKYLDLYDYEPAEIAREAALLREYSQRDR